MSSYKVYDDEPLYFATSTIVEWYPVFTKDSYFDVIIDSLKHCRQEKGLRIHAYVIMLNHIHLIISIDDNTSKKLSSVFRDFKRFSSKEISKLLHAEGKQNALSIFEKAAIQDGRKNNFKVWQDGFHPKAIYDEKFGLQKLEYIHNNPAEKGYVLMPEYWFYSTAAFYSKFNDVPLQVDNIFELNNN